MRKKVSSLLCLCLLTGVGAAAHADLHAIHGPRIGGAVRVYDFTRMYGGTLPDRHALDAAVAVGGRTGAYMGLSLGGVFYATHPLGLNSSNPRLVDATLAGYAPINVLGQAFIQYRGHYVRVRVGDQIVQTPWINPGDSRLVPATYRALVVTAHPTAGLCIKGLGVTAYKSRTSDAFTSTDLYNAVDTLNIGGAGGLQGETEPGAAALGVIYRDDRNRAKAWVYDFMDLANLVILQERHDFGRRGLHPFLGAQWVRQTSSGARYLGAVNATAYGALFGIARRSLTLSFRYNDIPAHPGAFAHGGIVSPYTSGYGTDPLYTTTMSQSLIDNQAPGHAFAIRFRGFFRRHTVRLAMGYARYYNALTRLSNVPYSATLDFDAAYYFRGPLQGLSVRDRVAIIKSPVVSDHLVYNRLMLQYRIGAGLS